MAYVIKEKYPDGKDSIKALSAWIQNADKVVSDSKDVWNTLIPVIKQSLRYEFSDANPNDWASLDHKYLKWKRNKSFPDTIGIMTGALKKSLVEIPRTEITRKKLIYSFNPNVAGYKGKVTGKYAHYFHKRRPIFGFTIDFVKSQVKDIVIKNWLQKFRKTVGL